MAIELLQPKAEDWRAIEVLLDCLIGGEHRTPGTRVKVPASDAFDLVAAKQAKYLSPADINQKAK